MGPAGEEETQADSDVYGAFLGGTLYWSSDEEEDGFGPRGLLLTLGTTLAAAETERFGNVALVVPTLLVGFDYNPVSMLLCALERSCSEGSE